MNNSINGLPYYHHSKLEPLFNQNEIEDLEPKVIPIRGFIEVPARLLLDGKGEETKLTQKPPSQSKRKHNEISTEESASQNPPTGGTAKPRRKTLQA